jgi:raffinose/stachyose/melibiose transport system permease protein
VPALYMYQNAFVYNRVGYASAIAVILAVAIFALAFLVVRLGGQEEQ